MKVSFNNWRGKPEKRPDNSMWYNGKKVNMGYGWVTVDMPLQDIWTALTIDGFPICPALKIEADGHRIGSAFESHQIALVDIDKNWTIQELLEDEFYQRFGTGFYASPSHTPSHHKFRIVHVLENPITKESDMRRLYLGLMDQYGMADVACKDGVRLFNGTENCKLKDLRTDVVLPDKIVKALIRSIRYKEEKAINEAEKNRSEAKTYKEPDDDEKRRIIELLKTMFIGEYPIWRDIGWGLKDGGYTLDDYVEATIGGMMNAKNRADCETIWNASSNTTNKVTMGTVIYHIKTRLGDDCLKPIRTKSRNINKIEEQLQLVRARKAELTTR